MSDPTFWDNPDKAREISQEATQLKNAVESYKQLVSDIEDANMMLEMAIDEDDLSMESEIKEYVANRRNLGKARSTFIVKW